MPLKTLTQCNYVIIVDEIIIVSISQYAIMMGKLSDDSLTLGPASAEANFAAPHTPSHYFSHTHHPIHNELNQEYTDSRLFSVDEKFGTKLFDRLVMKQKQWFLPGWNGSSRD